MGKPRRQTGCDLGMIINLLSKIIVVSVQDVVLVISLNQPCNSRKIISIAKYGKIGASVEGFQQFSFPVLVKLVVNHVGPSNSVPFDLLERD